MRAKTRSIRDFVLFWLPANLYFSSNSKQASNGQYDAGFMLRITSRSSSRRHGNPSAIAAVAKVRQSSSSSRPLKKRPTWLTASHFTYAELNFGDGLPAENPVLPDLRLSHLKARELYPSSFCRSRTIPKLLHCWLICPSALNVPLEKTMESSSPLSLPS